MNTTLFSIGSILSILSGSLLYLSCLVIETPPLTLPEFQEMTVNVGLLWIFKHSLSSVVLEEDALKDVRLDVIHQRLNGN